MESSGKCNQYWQEKIKASNESDLSQNEFCRQSNIGYWSSNQRKCHPPFRFRTQKLVILDHQLLTPEAVHVFILS